jgi:lipopolysaccharide export system permease protein
VPLNPPGQLDRVYFREDLLKIRDVANQFQSINADTASKGEREMSVCEMQKMYEAANRNVHKATVDSLLAVWRARSTHGENKPMPRDSGPPPKIGGIGALYCDMLVKYGPYVDKLGKYLHVQAAHAATLPARQDTTKARQDTTKPRQDTTKARQDTTKPRQDSAKQVVRQDTAKRPPANVPLQPVVTPAPAPAPVAAKTATPLPTQAVSDANNPEILDAKVRLDDARHSRNRYGVEIQKKFSLAAACIVFVLVGAPIALRFPRGGVGVVIGVSFFVFAVYYVGLIGGESLANKNIISPFWAMWADNILFALVGLLLMTRMGHEGVTSRGGNMGELIDAIRDRFGKRGRGAAVGTAEQPGGASA